MKELYRTIVRLAMQPDRNREIIIRAIPQLLKDKGRLQDTEAVAELKTLLHCTEQEAIILLRDAMEKDPEFASKVDVTYRAL